MLSPDVKPSKNYSIEWLLAKRKEIDVSPRPKPTVLEITPNEANKRRIVQLDVPGQARERWMETGPETEFHEGQVLIQVTKIEISDVVAEAIDPDKRKAISNSIVDISDVVVVAINPNNPKSIGVRRIPFLGNIPSSRDGGRYIYDTQLNKLGVSSSFIAAKINQIS